MLAKQYGAAMRQIVIGMGLAAAAAGACAEAWPSKPIRLIVPYAAGGFSDQAARVIGKALSDELKQPVVIDNRGGGGGRIGAEAVSRMAPDGYNLLLTTNGTHTYMAVTEKSLSYDPIKDFTPVSEIASYGLLMVVNPAVPAKNVKEFIAYAKSNPDKLSYASSGPGSGLHFAGEVFKSMAGVQMTHVPYKGSGPGLLDVISNVCQVIFAGEAKPHIDTGKVRLLGTTSARRDPRYPDMPTIAEGGVPGYDLTYWVGLFGPKGMPVEVRDRLSLAVKNILKDEALLKQFTTMGLVPVGSTPEQLTEQIRTETRKLREVAVNSGIVTP
jgi:tripartite-type tricarboxylate transporter receptor subunit TctC